MSLTQPHRHFGMPVPVALPAPSTWAPHPTWVPPKFPSTGAANKRRHADAGSSIDPLERPRLTESPNAPARGGLADLSGHAENVPRRAVCDADFPSACASTGQWRSRTMLRLEPRLDLSPSGLEASLALQPKFSDQAARHNQAYRPKFP